MITIWEWFLIGKNYTVAKKQHLTVAAIQHRKLRKNNVLTIAQNQTIIGSMMNEETKMIDYVAAEDGCIEFYAGLGNLVVKSNDIEVLTAAVKAAGGFAKNLMASSSCDFADEYGFPTQGAFDALLMAALEA